MRIGHQFSKGVLTNAHDDTTKPEKNPAASSCET